MAAATEAKPILCLIDDAQWLDAPSADALVFTARRLVAERIVILFSAREGEPRRFDAPGLQDLTLKGLDREPSEALLSRASSQLAPAVQKRLLSDAAGNPLALLELPVALSDSQLTGKAQLPSALPLTARLRGLFIQRIERLPQPTQMALLVAAAEETGELAVIFRAAAELTLPHDALDHAEETGLVRTQDAALEFRHPLVRSAVYDSAPIGRRQQAHAALATALGEAQPADRALWHRAMATLTPDDELACALEASAARSQQRGGHASAATAFERAAGLSDRDAARATRLARAAEAAWVAGQADRARGLVDRALPTADHHQRARLLYLTGVIEGRQGWLKHGVTSLLTAATLSDDPTLSLQILREAASMAVYAGDYEEVIAIGARADELPQGGDIDRYIVAAIAASAADMSGDHARGAALADLALELAESLDDPMCLISAAATATRQRVAADGLSFARRAVDIARERALVTALPLALQALARALIDWSQFDLAYSAAEEGWRLAIDVDQSWAASLNLAYLARIDALRGADQLVTGRVEELQALVASTGAKAIGCSTAMTQGLLELGRGRPAEALDRLLVVVSAVRPESNPMFTFGLPDAVEAAVRADRFDEIAVHLNRFRTWAPAPPALRFSRAAWPWSKTPTRISTSHARSSWEVPSHHSTTPGASCSTGSGCDATAGGSTHVSISGPRWRSSNSSPPRRGKRGHVQNYAPAARPRASATPRPAISSHRRSCRSHAWSPPGRAIRR